MHVNLKWPSAHTKPENMPWSQNKHYAIPSSFSQQWGLKTSRHVCLEAVQTSRDHQPVRSDLNQPRVRASSAENSQTTMQSLLILVATAQLAILHTAHAKTHVVSRVHQLIMFWLVFSYITVRAYQTTKTEIIQGEQMDTPISCVTIWNCISDKV